MTPTYILRYFDNNGIEHQEIVYNTFEAWQRYEELKTDLTTLKVEVYTRMMWYPDIKAE